VSAERAGSLWQNLLCNARLRGNLWVGIEAGAGQNQPMPGGIGGSMKNLLSLFAVAFLTSACALTTDRIDVPYQTLATARPVAGASAASVSVVAHDGRTVYQDRVSTKKNGYGMEMAPIMANNDIPQTVGLAVEQELKAEGFQIGPGHAVLSVDVIRFYNDFKIGFFSGDAIADVEIHVTLRDPANSIVFVADYEGSGKEADVMMASGSNARAALIKAFQNALNTLVSDHGLPAAIMAAQTPKAAAGSAPSS
jgi:uncharacterized lipoprotein YajG